MADFPTSSGDARQTAPKQEPIESQLHPGSGANDSTWTKIERAADVTVEGASGILTGAWHALKADAKPENWGKDLWTVGSSVALGVVMRTALPEAGAVAKAVSIGMGLMFAKDAVTPVYQGWQDVWNDNSTAARTKAVGTIQDGLGDFLVDGTASMVLAGWGAKKAPVWWNKAAPETWHSIETWKATNLGLKSSLATSLASGGDWMSTRIKRAADYINPQPKLDVPTGEEISKILSDLKLQLSTKAYAQKMYKEGATGLNGYTHGHNTTIELLLDGQDPHVVDAKVPEGKKSLADVDLSKQDSFFLADEKSETAQYRKNPKPADDDTQETQTPAGETADKNPWKKIVSPDTMGKMAKVIGTTLESQPDELGIMQDHVGETTGAVLVRTSPDVKPLEGYDEPVQSMVALGDQALKDPRVFVQIQDLLQRFASASIQSGMGEATAADFANRYVLLVADIGAHIFSMNQYAKENFTTYLHNIIQAGIDPKVALMNKAVPPRVEATSDIQQVGVNGDGKPIYSHEGPHTLPAIFGPNGEKIWPIDLVKYPIRELLLRALLAAGIYGHEFMHDQFGHLGEFDPDARETSLNEGAANALGPKAKETIDLPNGGVDPQQVLLNNIARRAAKIGDAHQREAFLNQNLMLDQTSRVMRGVEAADDLLGDKNAVKQIQVPGVGKMRMDVFIANIAAMADKRTATDVLTEMQGKGDPDATSKAVRSNISNILGANADNQVTLADGTTTTVGDLVARVSDRSRNPHFDTYDQPLPKSITWQELLVGIAKGWANETFADWGAAAESGQTAAPYFQALREDGLLSRSTVMAQEMRQPGNPLGIEAHPVDKLRPRYQAALIRALATAKGQHDQLLLDYADALDSYSRQVGQTGPIQIANMDAPGQKITIPEDVFDRFINELVQRQLSTPLPRLQGKTLFDILPDLRKNFRINNDMSDAWVKAIQSGTSPDTIPFDINKVKQTHVYGAGHLTFLKLVADGMDADKANERARFFMDYFSGKYLNGNPHAGTSFMKRLQVAPQYTLTKELPRTAGRITANTLRAHEPVVNYLGDRAPQIAGAGASMWLRDEIDLKKLQQQILGNFDFSQLSLDAAPPPNPQP